MSVKMARRQNCNNKGAILVSPLHSNISHSDGACSVRHQRPRNDLPDLHVVSSVLTAVDCGRLASRQTNKRPRWP